MQLPIILVGTYTELQQEQTKWEEAAELMDSSDTCQSGESVRVYVHTLC